MHGITYCEAHYIFSAPKVFEQKLFWQKAVKKKLLLAKSSKIQLDV